MAAVGELEVIVPIGKKGGGARPIAVGEAIVRVGASIALSRVLLTLLTEFAEVGQQAPSALLRLSLRGSHSSKAGSA